MIDLLIAAVLAVSIYIGWSQGMMRGLLTLAGTILALVAASHIADYAADGIVEQFIRPATHSAIEQRINELRLDDFILSPLEEMEQVIDAIENDFIREEAKKLLGSLGLSTDAAESTAKDTLLTLGGNVVDMVLYGAVREIISAVLCVLGFTVISFALRPVIWAIDKTFTLPLLRQVNQLCGLVFGAAKGVILVLVAVWVLRTLGLWVTEETIEQSYLLKIAVHWLNSWGMAPHSSGAL